MNKFLIILFLFVIAGCSSNPVIYNPSVLSEDVLSKISVKHSKTYKTWMQFIYNEKGDEITKRTGWDNLLSEVSLEEGIYKFKVRCASGVREAYPEVTAKIVQSKNYIIFCSVTKGKNLLGLKVDAFAEVIVKEI